MAWTDLSAAFGYGSTLPGARLRELRDNLTAVTSGYANAPRLQSAAIAANGVTSATLNATLAGMTVNSGNVHRHHGSDGAVISNVAAIGTRAIGNACLSNSSAVGSSWVAPGGTFSPTTPGFYVFGTQYSVGISSDGILAEILADGVWWSGGTQVLVESSGFIQKGGPNFQVVGSANFRVRNLSSTTTCSIIWRYFF